ncbi:restriction endonuclease subunit S [Ruegeria arenilitoris]|uniref:EcoKI restriction-modification system protein HsdS n=1 Tax=Ruegeria arenilitoris TaxID=1173585 RepID=A0A238JVI9_9RHOB|nr:restriction endonuclease subunit S [Ruegeria arenilitoris]SMX34679.1 EcoKI restriction-modification system protein HsdS [Ruegeria arenilitoris]
MTTHRLRDVAMVLTSNVDKVIDPDEHPVRLCNYVDVYKNNFIHTDMPFSPGSASAAEIKKFRVQVDDVIITKDSETADDIGVPALVKSTGDDLVCGYHLSILRANRRRMIGPFLYWHLLSKQSREDFGNAANGVTRYGLTLGGIKGIPVNVPDLATQRQIADFLDCETARIDLLIEKKQRLVALLGEREEGTFIEHVTGKNLPFEKKDSGVEWIKKIPTHWFAPKFTHIARQETGHTPSRKVENYWVPEECVIPWVSLADVWQLRDGGTIYISETSEKISEIGMANSAARLLPKDTVILSRTASVGFPAIMTKPMATTQDFAAWICGKQIRPLFLYYVLRAMKPEFRRLMMGSTHQTIYMPDIRSFRTPLPPLEEQDQIIARLSSTIQVFRQSATALTKSIDRLKEYRSALISAAVTGQIDVSTYAKSGTPDRRLDAIQEEMGA